ncbi:hypothetical protein [Ensifer sp. Root231]|uniref:hypothetical protein n=1 Tax=Ensifer sp. Root231 TaxID=1736497 RepID=UPI000AE42EC2|nr:hypothetical protein [Ensifer sp. Root231]
MLPLAKNSNTSRHEPTVCPGFAHALPQPRRRRLWAACEALRATVRDRIQQPLENDAIIQLHLDYRCLRGGKAALADTLGALGTALQANGATTIDLPLTSVSPRGEGIAIPMRLSRSIKAKLVKHGGDDVQVA